MTELDDLRRRISDLETLNRELTEELAFAYGVAPAMLPEMQRARLETVKAAALMSRGESAPFIEDSPLARMLEEMPQGNVRVRSTVERREDYYGSGYTQFTFDPPLGASPVRGAKIEQVIVDEATHFDAALAEINARIATCTLRIYSGPPPATVDDPLGDNVLLLDTPQRVDCAGMGDGRASFARCIDTDGNAFMQLTVGDVASRADVVLRDPRIQVGMVYPGFVIPPMEMAVGP